MRRTQWSPESRAHLREIFDFISARDPEAAESVVRRILATAEKLAAFNTGRPGRRSGTFEKLVSGLPYFIIYAVKDDRIDILDLIHTARDRP